MTENCTCEACKPTTTKRIRVWQNSGVYRTTIVYAKSASEAAQMLKENEHEYDWEYEQGEWETIEACSEGVIDE